VALVAGAAALLVVVGVIAATVRGGDRPEEAVARTFVAALLAGDASSAHALASDEYQLLVRPSDLELLAGALTEVVGEDPEVDVLGSERTPGASPATSLVGYRGRTAVGPIEGVVTVVADDTEGPWRVRDVSYRFPEADDEELGRLPQVTRELNEALADRAARGTVPAPAP
jgi:hypothetical protein